MLQAISAVNSNDILHWKLSLFFGKGDRVGLLKVTKVAELIRSIVRVVASTLHPNTGIDFKFSELNPITPTVSSGGTYE